MTSFPLILSTVTLAERDEIRCICRGKGFRVSKVSKFQRVSGGFKSFRGFQKFQRVSRFQGVSMATIQKFEEIAVFQMARELCKEVYAITREGEFKFDSRFVQQIRAAAGSVMDNIAEGYERDGNKEFINFLYIAKGSCGEVRSQIIRAHDVGFIDDDKFNDLYGRCKNISIGIANFIKGIRGTEIKGQKFL